MKIAVLGDEQLTGEFKSKSIAEGVEIEWAGSLKILMATDADAYFDLQFEQDPERNSMYGMRKELPVFVNSVALTTRVIGRDLIRINAWPGMLQRNVVELSASSASRQALASKVLDALGWEYRFIPDLPGMISPRVLAMIINEAYYTLGDGVSSREEIDIAMKLGTNYPMGPFEWSRSIGLYRVAELLHELSRNDPRYSIAPALKNDLK